MIHLVISQRAYQGSMIILSHMMLIQQLILDTQQSMMFDPNHWNVDTEASLLTMHLLIANCHKVTKMPRFGKIKFLDLGDLDDFYPNKMVRFKHSSSF